MSSVYRPLQSIDDIFGPLCIFIVHVHLIRVPSIEFRSTILGKHTKNGFAVSTVRFQTWKCAHTSALCAPSRQHTFWKSIFSRKLTLSTVWILERHFFFHCHVATFDRKENRSKCCSMFPINNNIVLVPRTALCILVYFSYSNFSTIKNNNDNNNNKKICRNKTRFTECVTLLFLKCQTLKFNIAIATYFCSIFPPPSICIEFCFIQISYHLFRCQWLFGELFLIFSTFVTIW